jgi:hypothetical protein
MNIQFWQDMQNKFLIGYLEEWKAEKEKNGYVPTVELLIEELNEKKDEKYI